MTRLIGLTGRKRAGKSSVAAILVAEFGFVEVSFAAPLRGFVAGLLGCSVEDMEAFKEDPHPVLGGKSPRYAMQTIGTEWGRDMIAGDLWVRVARRRIQQLLKNGQRVVVSDVRFPNEAELVLELGGYGWRVQRPGLSDNDSHISEAGLPDHWISAEIENDGDLNDLAIETHAAWDNCFA